MGISLEKVEDGHNEKDEGEEEKEGGGYENKG